MAHSRAFAQTWSQIWIKKKAVGLGVMKELDDLKRHGGNYELDMSVAILVLHGTIGGA